MTAKRIPFHAETRENVLRGAAQLARDKEYLDLLAAGIVDPAKGVRLALEHAASVASVLLLTEATMTEKPEKREPHAAPVPES